MQIQKRLTFPSSQRRGMLLAIGILGLFVAGFTPPQYGYRIVKAYPHDRAAFTQGFEFRDGVFYEGTGLVGRSSLRKINLETGQIQQRYDVPPPFFGEGITVLNDQIFEL